MTLRLAAPAYYSNIVDFLRFPNYHEQMPMTPDQIVQETREWPSERLANLLLRLTENLHASDPETETAWKSEIDRRLEEIESGKVSPIPASEVFGKAASILNR